MSSSNSSDVISQISSLSDLFGLQITTEHTTRLLLYVELLEKWQKHINLTGRLSQTELLQDHFFECFWLTQEFLKGRLEVCDIGAGAGFPGLAAKVFRPTLRVTLLEPNQKRVVFLKEVARALRLEVKVIATRAEQHSNWNNYDIATSRALKPSFDLLRILEKAKLPLLYLHGTTPQALRNQQVLRSETVPGSKRRRATLFRIAPHVD